VKTKQLRLAPVIGGLFHGQYMVMWEPEVAWNFDELAPMTWTFNRILEGAKRVGKSVSVPPVVGFDLMSFTTFSAEQLAYLESLVEALKSNKMSVVVEFDLRVVLPFIERFDYAIGHLVEGNAGSRCNELRASFQTLEAFDPPITPSQATAVKVLEIRDKVDTLEVWEYLTRAEYTWRVATPAVRTYLFDLMESQS
jgi:hypothetical protein